MSRIVFVTALVMLPLTPLTPLAANAVLIVRPSTGLCTSVEPPCLLLTGTQTSQAQINAAIAAALGGSVQLYENDVEPFVETASFAGSYQTALLNSESDPSDATITYVGGPVMNATHLLVKDGNHQPAWYLFSLDWNGTERIWLRDFWPDGGAISHVTLYGGGDTTTKVPEPGTMGLIGAGLLAFGLLRRRKAA